jgi:polyhydroxybutyrate depolymerase
MSYTVACEAPESFTGMASYAGIMSGETWDTCDTTHPISVLHIHGTDDFVVPDDGSMTTWKGWGGAPAVLDMLHYWITRNTLDISTEIALSDTIELFEFTSNDSSYKVTYYRLLDIGHNWPGDDDLIVDEDLLNDTSQLIWDFFETLIS